MGSFFAMGSRPDQQLAVCCKRCQRFVPPGVAAAPADNIVVTCPLCGERRRYRPSEVVMASLDIEIAHKPVLPSVTPKHLQYRRKA